MFCCGGDDKPAKKAGEGAGVEDESGNYELSEDHAAYMAKSQAKTAAKNKEIAAAYAKENKSGTPKTQAAARFWFEFKNLVSERLAAITEIGQSDEEKEKKQAEDPKAAHDKFMKELNFELEESVMQIWHKYAETQDTGDTKIDKEASMEFFDNFLKGSGAMAMTSVQEYTRYTLKHYAQMEEGLQANRKEFVDNAEKAAIKQSKVDALGNAMGKASKPDSIPALVKAIADAEAVEGDVTAAKEKLATLQAAKIAIDTSPAKLKADAKAAEAKTKADEKAAAAKVKRQEKMDDAAKKTDDDKADKEKADEEKKTAEAKAKKDEADAKLKTEADEAEAAADKVTKEKAKTSADENWLLKLNTHIEKLILDWTYDYEESLYTRQKAGFEAFFNGENKPGDEYELSRDYLNKVLTLGSGEEAGSFEAFLQGLGFKVMEKDATEEVKKVIEEKKADDAK